MQVFYRSEGTITLTIHSEQRYSILYTTSFSLALGSMGSV